MSLQDMGRYLELVAKLANDDPDVWVPAEALTEPMREHMSRGDDELRTKLRLRGLWEADFVALSTDGKHVAITPKGL